MQSHLVVVLLQLASLLAGLTLPDLPDLPDLPEPPEPVSPGIGRARIARGLLIEVAAKERTPRELLEIVSGLAVLPAWVSSDPLRAITDQDAEWASADAHQTSTKAKEALDVALDELAGWVSAGHG